jgi:hypothetical protein
MKKIKLFLAAAALVVLGNSCSSDDDSGGSSINQDQLIGTWQIVSLTEDGEAVELSECELTETLVFTASEFTSNQPFTFNDECDTSEFSLPYTLDGNVISAGVDGVNLDELPIDFGDLFGDLIDVEDIEVETETSTSEITTLNETTLVIRDTFQDEEGTEVDVTTYRRI